MIKLEQTDGKPLFVSLNGFVLEPGEDDGVTTLHFGGGLPWSVKGFPDEVASALEGSFGNNPSERVKRDLRKKPDDQKTKVRKAFEEEQARRKEAKAKPEEKKAKKQLTFDDLPSGDPW